MKQDQLVHAYCDICGGKLSTEETEKNKEYENYEFPICDECFNDALNKINYILEK